MTVGAGAPRTIAENFAKIKHLETCEKIKNEINSQS